MKLDTIVISRTDSIGDVMLTLPMCVWLRRHYPNAKLVFIGKNYTKSVIDCFSMIDEFIDIDDLLQLSFTKPLEQLKGTDCFIHVFPNGELAKLAKKAKIPVRIGTSHRFFHLLTCNYRPNFTRKNSELHESQLNFELLRPLGLKEIPSLEAIQNDITYFKPKTTELPDFIQAIDFQNTVILHPKSQGSAIEWPIEKYIELAQNLVDLGKTVCFTGTENEGANFRNLLPIHERIIDTTGKLSLEQLIYFISKSEVLVACSTGPYHIAGMTGIKAIGLFSSRKPIHPGRWKALGPKATFLVYDENCEVCKNEKFCDCVKNISVEKVLHSILNNA